MLIPVSHMVEEFKGVQGGGEAWEVKVLEMVGTKRNGRGYETMPS